MALQKITKKGYGQIELNQVAFRRDGRIEAQCKLDANSFAANQEEKDGGKVYAENGMILAIDNITRTVKLPTGSDDLYGINYSTEHMYDERANALKDFYLKRGEFLPRLGYLAIGDKFTTNTIAYDDTEFAAVTTTGSEKTAEQVFQEGVADLSTTNLYGKPCANGYIQVTATKPTAGLALKVIKSTTMPDGQFALKFQVIAD